MKKTLILCALVSAFSLSGKTWSDDWPQYRGPHGDGKSAESISDASKLEVLWRAPTPLGFSSFSIADGKAYTVVAREGSNATKTETCIALNAETGKEIWSVPLGESDYGHDGGNAGAPDNRGGDGPRSTPATDGQHVYVFDSHLVLNCFNAANGELVWKHDVEEEFAGRNIKWHNATSPLLVGDVLYVSGGGAGQTFLAFDKTSGKLIWQSGDETITHATPAYANIGGSEQVIFFTTSGLVSADAKTGAELWKAKFPFSVSTAASPIVAGNKVYCSAGYGVGAGLFEIGDEHSVDELWFKANELMNHWSTPVVHDGHLYGIYEFKKYGKAPLQCVNLASGEIVWSERGFGPGNCILVGDKLVVLSDAGEVAVVKATPAEYNEVGRIKAVSGKCWSTPAFANGRIYVRSTEEAACIVVE